MDNSKSLKQVIQKMIPENIGLVEGIVVSTSPLSIQIVNNSKMIASENTLIISKHVTDYTAEIVIDLEVKEVTILNGLQIGEKVNMLRFNNGELYYVLDRVV